MSKQFYKNVSLKSFDVNGVQSWRLLGPDGSPIRAFDVFAKTLLRAKRNTRKGYCRWLAEFFDFVIEASFHWRLVGDGMHSREAFQDILEAYDEFLFYGEQSGNSIAQVVSKTIPSPRNSRTTSATKHAAVRYFLKLSEQIRKQMLELTKVGEGEFVDEQRLFIGMGEKQTISTFQRQTLVANSMLAGLHRFEVADALVGNLVSYFKRKKAEFPSWTDETNFARIRRALVQKAQQGIWTYTDAEQDWIMARLRERCSDPAQPRN